MSLFYNTLLRLTHIVFPSQYLHIIINAALSLLDQPVTQALRLANLEVLVNSVLYNAVAALHIMETKQAGTARKFFDLWFAAINGENKLPRVHDKKLSILTLSALMEVPAANVPDSLRDGWPGIVGGALRLFKDLPKAIEGALSILPRNTYNGNTEMPHLQFARPFKLSTMLVKRLTTPMRRNSSISTTKKVGLSTYSA